MKRLSLATATLVLGLVLIPATAHAATLRGFVVRDRGADIVWAVTVCTKTSVWRHFNVALEPADGSDGINIRFSSTRPFGGCKRHWLLERDDFANGAYWTRMRVSIREGYGLVGHTAWKRFRIYG